MIVPTQVTKELQHRGDTHVHWTGAENYQERGLRVRPVPERPYYDSPWTPFELVVDHLAYLHDQRDLSFIFVTNHQNLIDAWNFRNRCAQSNCPVKIYPGCEFEVFYAWQGREKLAHLLGLFLEDDWPWRTEGPFQVAELAEGIKDRGGLVVVPHPVDFERHAHRVIGGMSSAMPFSEVERLVREGVQFDALGPVTVFPYYHWARPEVIALAERPGLGILPGTDAHSYWDIGVCTVFPKFTGDLKQDLIRALGNREVEIPDYHQSLIAFLVSLANRTSMGPGWVYHHWVQITKQRRQSEG